MADQNITALPATTTPESSDQLLLVGATEEKLIDYDKLADAILGKIASKNFALDQGNKTLLQALNELNSKTMNYRALHYYRIMQGEEGKTQTFTFTDCEQYRSPFIYVHGSQIPNKTTIAIGMLRKENNDVTIDFVSKLHGEAEISFQNNTIISESNESWSNGFVIY